MDIVEKELILLAQSGDNRAFTRLIDKYQERVYQTLFWIIRNEDEARDLTQEVFIKVLTNIKKFRLQSSFFTWVYWNIIDVSSRYFRSKHFSFNKNVHPIESKLHTLKGHGSILDSSIKKERDTYILDMISSLPKKYRLVILLCDLDKLPYKETSAILKCSEGTIKSRLFRARMILKKKLENLKHR